MSTKFIYFKGESEYQREYTSALLQYGKLYNCNNQQHISDVHARLYSFRLFLTDHQAQQCYDYVKKLKEETLMWKKLEDSIKTYGTKPTNM